MIKVPEFKEHQQLIASERFLNPKKLYLPLSQHTGRPSILSVKLNDEIEEGQCLAKEDGFISSSLYSPAKGKIVAFEKYNHPNLGKAETIVIQCQNQARQYSLREEVTVLEKEELITAIKSAGIVGMGGAAFPTPVKLKPPKKIDTLIINGCECEPYLASDCRLMVENLQEIFRGIEVIVKIIEPRRVIFAVEDNKDEAIKNINLFRNTKDFNLPEIKLAILKSAYPQGGEKQLIYSTTKRKVSGGQLPLDVGCLVHNVATCFAIYEAVYFSKPLIERLVSFCGDALVSPKNIWLKIGTTLKELFDSKILEFKAEPKKIISGGPMMGIALSSLDYPILKGSGGFLFLNKPIKDQAEESCVRCARCVDACPMNLMPLEYTKRVKLEQYKALEEFNIADCIECGSCSYVCPAKIPLVHYIKTGKKYAPKNK